MTDLAANHELSLTRGGPFYDLLCHGHLVRPRGHVRWIAIAAIAWVPIAIGSLARLALGHPPDAVTIDPTVHVRLLVSVPLLVLAEHVLETRCHAASRLIHEQRLAEPDAAGAIFATAEKLRASRLAEGIIALVAFCNGQAVLWGLTWPGEILPARDADAPVSFAAFWHATVSLPLVQFLVLRWLWRWGVWTYVLYRLSRRPLATNARHPDGAAGLRFLSTPVDGFAWFVTANLSVAATAWIVKIELHGVPIATFVPRLVAFIAVALVLAFAPLLLFAGQLSRARHPDVETRPVPFTARSVVALCTAALVPMIPVVIAVAPVWELATQVGRMLQLPGF